MLINIVIPAQAGIYCCIATWKINGRSRIKSGMTVLVSNFLFARTCRELFSLLDSLSTSSRSLEEISFCSSKLMLSISASRTFLMFYRKIIFSFTKLAFIFLVFLLSSILAMGLVSSWSMIFLRPRAPPWM